jgi:hypothetical protein
MGSGAFQMRPGPSIPTGSNPQAGVAAAIYQWPLTGAALSHCSQAFVYFGRGRRRFDGGGGDGREIEVPSIGGLAHLVNCHRNRSTVIGHRNRQTVTVIVTVIPMRRRGG